MHMDLIKYYEIPELSRYVFLEEAFDIKLCFEFYVEPYEWFM